MEGGFPIFSEGEIVGAVGVSGAGIKDIEISRTAAAALGK
ncbi:MAG TPA: heme-binding protein [Candidatus Binatia bacterium]|nr:heme-binding protein [Candidatus Binatia bacterium]